MQFDKQSQKQTPSPPNSETTNDSGLDSYVNDFQSSNPRCYDPPREMLLDRTSFHTEFCTDAYLSDFYTDVDDCAMQMVLTFLPHIAAKIPKVKRLLDFGAGPTIHVPVCFRNKVEEFYLADFLPQNRKELLSWHNKTSTFNWTKPLKIICNREVTEFELIPEMLEETRSKVKGIFHCDAFKKQSVNCAPSIQQSFDIITSIFCLEYCTETEEEFTGCVQNVLAQLKPGGYYIMGGVLEETWCAFGGKKFTCLYLTEKVLFDALRKAGMLVDNDKEYQFFNDNGMYMVFCKKDNK